MPAASYREFFDRYAPKKFGLPFGQQQQAIQPRLCTMTDLLTEAFRRNMGRRVVVGDSTILRRERARREGPQACGHSDVSDRVDREVKRERMLLLPVHTAMSNAQVTAEGGGRRGADAARETEDWYERWALLHGRVALQLQTPPPGSPSEPGVKVKMFVPADAPYVSVKLRVVGQLYRRGSWRGGSVRVVMEVARVVKVPR